MYTCFVLYFTKECLFCVVSHKGVPETIFKLSLADIKEGAEDKNMFDVVGSA